MLCKNRWQDDKNDQGRRVIWWVKIPSSFLQRLNQYLSVWFFVLVNFVIMLLLITCTLKQSVKQWSFSTLKHRITTVAVSKTNAAKEYQHSWGFLKQHVECIWIFINKKKNSNQPSIQGLNKKHKMWRWLEYALPASWKYRCKKNKSLKQW